MTPQDMSEKELRAWIKGLTAAVRAKEEAMESGQDEPMLPMEFDESAGFLCEYPECNKELDEAGMCEEHTKLMAKLDEENKQ